MEEITSKQNLETKRNDWRRKNWSILELRGGKNNWFLLAKSLIILVSENKANGLDTTPSIPEINQLQTWRIYVPFLKGIGLVSNQAGVLCLSEEGIKFLNNPTQRQLADIIHEKIRLFGELLNLIALTPMTVEEANESICKEYDLNWNHLSNTRRRMDWLEVLGLIQEIGNRKWKITEEGKKALNAWDLITTEVLEPIESDSNKFEISNPPEDIAVLLNNLMISPELHIKRNTYNIWAPSPNRIENLRIIVQAATEKNY